MASFSHDFTTDTTGDWDATWSPNTTLTHNSGTSDATIGTSSGAYDTKHVIETTNALTDDEQIVQAQFQSRSQATESFGVVFRAPATEGKCYHARESGGKWRLEKVDGNGDFIEAHTSDAGSGLGMVDGYWYSFRLTGTTVSGGADPITLEVWRDSADPGTDPSSWGTADATSNAVASAPDGIITGNFHVGARYFTGTNNSNASVRWDNFYASDVTAAGAANPKGPLGMPFHGPFGGPIGA